MLFIILASTVSIEAFGQSAAVTDTLKLTVGGCCITSGFFGYWPSQNMGSASPTQTSDGHQYIRITDDFIHCTPKAGCAEYATFSVSGFVQDPSYAWLFSITANGVTMSGSVAQYSYSNGTATWHWMPGGWNFQNGKSYTVTVGHNLVGYVNPKFYVVGVTYAPPGPVNNVDYTNSNLVGTKTTLSQSYASGVTNSVSLSKGFVIAVFKGSITSGYNTTTTVTTKDTSSITSTIQVQNGERTFGTANYFAPVNHDYDVIWVWLNPAVILTVGNKMVAWTGLGYDTADQNGPDIVPVELGYLNGHFGPIPPDIRMPFDRVWAAGQIYGAGEGAALTSADLAQIAAADPFSVSTYGTNFVGYTPPTETSDHRFTLSLCNSSGSFNYQQAGPSVPPEVYTCTLTYTNGSTQSHEITNSFQQTWSVDVSLGGRFLARLSGDVKTSHQFTWTTDAQTEISSTTTSSGALSVQGPACNNVKPGVGPCVPVYDANGHEPFQFQVYQDNMYGTFMFAPVHFY
jgi:hypothetical protein